MIIKKHNKEVLLIMKEWIKLKEMKHSKIKLNKVLSIDQWLLLIIHVDRVLLEAILINLKNALIFQSVCLEQDK